MIAEMIYENSSRTDTCIQLKFLSNAWRELNKYYP